MEGLFLLGLEVRLAAGDVRARGALDELAGVIRELPEGELERPVEDLHAAQREALALNTRRMIFMEVTLSPLPSPRRSRPHRTRRPRRVAQTSGQGAPR